MFLVKLLKKVANGHVLLVFSGSFGDFRDVYLGAKLLGVKLDWFMVVGVFKDFINIVFRDQEFFFFFNVNIDF